MIQEIRVVILDEISMVKSEEFSVFCEIWKAINVYRAVTLSERQKQAILEAEAEASGDEALVEEEDPDEARKKDGGYSLDQLQLVVGTYLLAFLFHLPF